MITTAIIALLRESTELNAIVGARIRPNVIKANEVFPAMYVSSSRMARMGCDDSTGIKTGVVEIGIHAEKYEQCVSAMTAIRAKLDDFSGVKDGVGITILNGEELPDEFSENAERSIKIIEFEAYAQIKI